MSAIERFLIKHIFKKQTKLAAVIALILSLAVVIAALSSAVYFILPQIMSCISFLSANLPQAIDYLNGLYVKLVGADRQIIDLYSLSKKLTELAGSLIGSISSVLDGITTGAAGLILCLYFLLDKKRLSIQVNKLINNLAFKYASSIIATARRLYNSMVSFFIGISLESLIVGILYIILLSILKIPYALPISIMNAMLTLIPYVGPLIGCAVGFCLICYRDSTAAFIYLIVFTIISIVEGQLIYPRVVGRAVKLPPVWMITSAIVGGRLGGFIGAVLFIPCAATVYSTLRYKTKSPRAV